ncbi:hypothetical protein Pan241w_02060 [Gimesia alba]|uniref:Nucleotidyltransferase domain protein n=1 Tax=Gimesia alba TaxID=2527973 RepID=A0A517R8P9_9PLAN|nr:hypothetical protein [Gimesia alba]QDT40153.1 hypothetical protein Pan241w_02060 [Gimesia alba]
MNFFSRHRTLDHSCIVKILHELRDVLTTTLANELTSVIVFGDFVKQQQFDSKHSKLNLMLVLNRIDCDLLDSIADAIAKFEKQVPLATMILTQDDLISSCDVFPVKFHNIKQYHTLLHGQDVISDLDISDEHLRLRCEQELKNIMIRLRTIYLHRRHKPEQLLQTLLETANSFLNNVNACLLVKTGIVPEEDSDVLDEFGDEFQIDVAVIRKILEFRRLQQMPSSEELKKIYSGFMSLIHETTHLVDQMEATQ